MLRVWCPDAEVNDLRRVCVRTAVNRGRPDQRLNTSGINGDIASDSVDQASITFSTNLAQSSWSALSVVRTSIEQVPNSLPYCGAITTSEPPVTRNSSVREPLIRKDVIEQRGNKRSPLCRANAQQAA